MNIFKIQFFVFLFIFFKLFYFSLQSTKYTAVPFNQPNKFDEKEMLSLKYPPTCIFRLVKINYFASLLTDRGLKTIVRYGNPDFKGTLLKLSSYKPLISLWSWNKKSVSIF